MVAFNFQACRLLGAAVAADVRRVRLNLRHGVADRTRTPRALEWKTLDPDRLARREGFADFDDLAAFWRRHHREAWSWEGWLIDWRASFVAAAT